VWLQVLIGRAVRQYQLNSSNEDHRLSQELQLSVTQRLFTIAITDFLCWFPIGVLGILAACGMPIASERNTPVFVVMLGLQVNVMLLVVRLNLVVIIIDVTYDTIDNKE
jgi:hypothetical protein